MYRRLSSYLFRRNLLLLPAARSNFNQITRQTHHHFRTFHATRCLYDSVKENAQTGNVKTEQLSFMLENVTNWEKHKDSQFKSVPPLKSIIEGFRLWLAEKGKPLSQDTVEAIETSYSILLQHQNWDEEHSKNPLALFHASLIHALVLQDVVLTEEQLDHVKKAAEAFKLFSQMSEDTQKIVQKTFRSLLKQNTEEQRKELSINTILRTFDTLDSLRHTPKPIPENLLNPPPETAAISEAEIAKLISDGKTQPASPGITSPSPSSSTSSSSSSPSSSPSSSSSSSTSPSPSPSPSSSSSSSSSTSASSPSPSPNASTAPSLTPATSEIPKMPWLINVDVDSLTTPRKLSYFLGMWYRLAFSRFTSFSDFMPSRLLTGAYTAMQSFAENLNEGNLDNLKEMLSAPLYKYYENLLKVYKEKNIKLVLNMKPIEEGFITDYIALQYMNPKYHDYLAGIIPGDGPSFQELHAMAIRRKLTNVGFAFWQEPDDGTVEDGYDPAAHATRAEVMRAQIFVSFSVYANCKEVYYLKDAEGKIIEGSESTTENGHQFTFFTAMHNVQWKIVDMNQFNAKISDEVPLFQIAPDEHYLVQRNYKKM